MALSVRNYNSARVPARVPDRHRDDVNSKPPRAKTLEHLPRFTAHPLLPGVESRVVHQLVLHVVECCVCLEPLREGRRADHCQRQHAFTSRIPHNFASIAQHAKEPQMMICMHVADPNTLEAKKPLLHRTRAVLPIHLTQRTLAAVQQHTSSLPQIQVDPADIPVLAGHGRCSSQHHNFTSFSSNAPQCLWKSICCSFIPTCVCIHPTFVCRDGLFDLLYRALVDTGISHRSEPEAQKNVCCAEAQRRLAVRTPSSIHLPHCGFCIISTTCLGAT
mmetsp:Transcript_6836/g.17012  ORF Transcript_6836/g.17012 Transcript_6836/m.17012 type:complete len:275 (-) Transcript_6836:1045-1869(-)